MRNFYNLELDFIIDLHFFNLLNFILKFKLNYFINFIHLILAIKLVYFTQVMILVIIIYQLISRFINII